MNINEKLFTECRLKLNYVSLIKLSFLLGFCAGVVSIPFVLLLTAEIAKFNIVSVIFCAPISGVILGLLMAVLGYPLYSWITAKIDGQVLSGFFQVNADSVYHSVNQESAE